MRSGFPQCPTAVLRRRLAALVLTGWALGVAGWALGVAGAQAATPAGEAMREGEALFAEERFDAAAEAFGRAVEADPQNPETYRRRGLARSRLGEHPGAIADFTRALRLAPDHVPTLYQRANALFFMGRRDDCLADCDRVVALSPGDLRAFMLRGTAREKFGLYIGALADYDRALALAPEDPVVLNQIAWLLATSPDATVRDGRRALELARRASAIRPEPQIIDSLAAAYAELGRFEVARIMQQNAIDAGRQRAGAMNLVRYRERLDAYAAGRPWRQTPLATEDGPKPVADDVGRVAPYTVQVASFRDRELAVSEARRLLAQGHDAFCNPARIPGRGLWYRLYIGRYEKRVETLAAAAATRKDRYRSAQAVHRPVALILTDMASDLSPSAAERLAAHGLVVPAGAPAGAFESPAAAAELVERLRRDGFRVRVVGE